MSNTNINSTSQQSTSNEQLAPDDYRKNSNTIRMILTESRGPLEGLRIIQVNLKNA